MSAVETARSGDVVRGGEASRQHAAVDILLVAGGYLAVYFTLQYLGIARAGACSVLAALGLAAWRLHARGEGWKSIGLIRPRSVPAATGAVLALYAAVVAGTLAIIEPLALVFGWRGLDLSSFAHLRGNPAALAQVLVIAWTTAAIGEELLFRGFLLTRIERTFGAGRAGAAGAVALQAAIFGAAHAYLGPRGIATAALVGVIYGAWYVLRGRNLWSLIVAHGLTDTISLLAIAGGVLR